MMKWIWYTIIREDIGLYIKFVLLSPLIMFIAIILVWAYAVWNVGFRKNYHGRKNSKRFPIY